jgi:hypothetical protein
VVDQARLDGLVEQLNAALGEVTPYKLAVVPPGEIRPVDKNAHYMPKRVYDQLLANVRQDGNLASLPFCWRDKAGKFVSLSGNHRVQVAQAADIPLVLVLYTDARLSKPQRRAIQLSHNALVGQDNPTTLRELWAEIGDLQWKIYAGLDEELLETMEPINVARISETSLRFEELVLLFLPAEIDRIQETLQRLGSTTKRRFAARYEDFDRFFETLLEFKEAQGIINTATAFTAMIEIVEAWLTEHNVTEQDEPEKSGS